MKSDTSITYFIVRYDTPNGRPTRKFYDVDDDFRSAEDRAYSFYVLKKDAKANPEMLRVTEQRIK